MAKTYKNFRKNRKHISKRRNNKKAKRTTYKKKIVGGLNCSDLANPENLKICKTGIYEQLAEMLRNEKKKIEQPPRQLTKTEKNPSSFYQEFNILLAEVRSSFPDDIEKADDIVLNEYTELIKNIPTLLTNIIQSAENKGILTDLNISNYFYLVKKNLSIIFSKNEKIYNFMDKITLVQFKQSLGKFKTPWKGGTKEGGGVVGMAVLGAILGSQLDPTGIAQALLLVTVTGAIVVCTGVYLWTDGRKCNPFQLPRKAYNFVKKQFEPKDDNAVMLEEIRKAEEEEEEKKATTQVFKYYGDQNYNHRQPKLQENKCYSYTKTYYQHPHILTETKYFTNPNDLIYAGKYYNTSSHTRNKQHIFFNGNIANSVIYDDGTCFLETDCEHSENEGPNANAPDPQSYQKKQ
jgi:hypothetical protein